MNNKTISVFGHKAPDSDTVLSAIILSKFFESQGENSIPMVLGEINSESKYILDRYGVPYPKLLNKISEIAGNAVAIVDTTSINQLPEGIEKMDIRMIVDHHNLGGLTTTGACEFWGRACGATCSILHDLFKFYKVPISKTISALMLSGILTDTLCLSLSTTTEKDKKTARRLARMLGENIFTLWDEILDAKSDISNLTDEQLLTADMKEFIFGGKKFLIANIEIRDSTAVLPRLKNIKTKMNELKNEKGCFGVLLFVIDITRSKTLFIAETDDNRNIGQILNVDFLGNEAVINKIVSRKKDIIPALQRSF
jgi:manganese-dependent inorganic pyrophosphatase